MNLLDIPTNGRRSPMMSGTSSVSADAGLRLLTSILLEGQNITLCTHHFARSVEYSHPYCNALTSLIARMGHARRLFTAAQHRSLRSLFRHWSHIYPFQILHKYIRILSRRSKWQRLAGFRKENADPAFRYEILDLRRRIRHFKPKHSKQYIQIFDKYGAPLTP